MFTSLNEEQFFLSHIEKTNKVLEYGSGDSTLQIASLCKEVVSIEHNQQWYDRITKRIPNNCKILLHKPNLEYIEGFEDGSYEEFKDYINAPINYGPFDIILIDGRARNECAKICHLMANGKTLIFVHDFVRVEYEKMHKYFIKIDQRESMAKFIIKKND